MNPCCHRLLPASRRCHTAPAGNAARCPALLPLTGTRPHRGSAATRTAGAVGQRDCRRRRSSARLAPAPHLAPPGTLLPEIEKSREFFLISPVQGLTRLGQSKSVPCPTLPDSVSEGAWRALCPAATQELTRTAPNRHPAPPRAVSGRSKSGCTIAHHGTRHDHPCTPGDGAGAARADANRAARGRGRHRSGRSGDAGSELPSGARKLALQRNLPSHPTWTASVTGSPSCRRASTPPPTNCCATCTSSISSTAGRASAPAPTGSTGAPASTSAPPARSCAWPPRWPSCPTSPRPWRAAGSPIRRSEPSRGWLPLPPRRGCWRWPAAPPPRRWSGWCVGGGRQTTPRRRMASRYAWRAAC